MIEHFQVCSWTLAHYKSVLNDTTMKKVFIHFSTPVAKKLLLATLALERATVFCGALVKEVHRYLNKVSVVCRGNGIPTPFTNMASDARHDVEHVEY